MTAADATRLVGEAYRTRLAHGEAAPPDDETRLAQKGYLPHSLTFSRENCVRWG